MKLGLLFVSLSLLVPPVLIGAEPPESTLPPVVVSTSRLRDIDHYGDAAAVAASVPYSRFAAAFAAVDTQLALA